MVRHLVGRISRVFDRYMRCFVLCNALNVGPQGFSLNPIRYCMIWKAACKFLIVSNFLAPSVFQHLP